MLSLGGMSECCRKLLAGQVEKGKALATREIVWRPDENLDRGFSCIDFDGDFGVREIDVPCLPLFGKNLPPSASGVRLHRGSRPRHPRRGFGPQLARLLHDGFACFSAKLAPGGCRVAAILGRRRDELARMGFSVDPRGR